MILVRPSKNLYKNVQEYQRVYYIRYSWVGKHNYTELILCFCCAVVMIQKRYKMAHLFGIIRYSTMGAVYMRNKSTVRNWPWVALIRFFIRELESFPSSSVKARNFLTQMIFWSNKWQLAGSVSFYAVSETHTCINFSAVVWCAFKFK